MRTSNVPFVVNMVLVVAVTILLCKVRRSMEFGLGMETGPPEDEGKDKEKCDEVAKADLNPNPSTPPRGNVDVGPSSHSGLTPILHHSSVSTCIEAPSMTAFLSHFTSSDSFYPPITHVSTKPISDDLPLALPSGHQDPLLLGIKSEAAVELIQQKVNKPPCIVLLWNVNLHLLLILMLLCNVYV